MNKRLFISGGKGGLASAVSDVFGQAGWHIDAPSRSELDVADKTAVALWFKGREAYDLAICNAGISGDALLLRQDGEQWDRVINTNLGGAAWCAKSAARAMKKAGRGHVVLIGSYVAEHPKTGQALYAASKAALKGLVKTLAVEWGGDHIRVNLVYPGFLETAMTAALPENVREAALARHALGRFTTAPQSARFLLFLHDHLTATSGQLFSLDSRMV